MSDNSLSMDKNAIESL